MAASTKKRWQKHETRTVRPFRSAEDYLWDTSLRLYADQEFVAAETITADRVDSGRLAVALRVPQLPDSIEELAGIPAKDLRFVISLEDRTFKTREIAYECELSALYSEAQIIDLPLDVVQQMSWAGETKVHVAVVLRASRAGEVGTAERIGSWIARKAFTIGKPKETSSFNIQAVEPEYFQARGLPPSTTYLIEIADEDLNQSCENLPNLIKVSLAKEVHGALGRDENSPVAKAFIRAVYVDVVTTVMATGFSSLSEPIEADGILDVVTKRLAKASGVPAAKLQAMAKEASGAKLRAVVQAEVDLSRNVISATQRRAG